MWKLVLVGWGVGFDTLLGPEGSGMASYRFGGCGVLFGFSLPPLSACSLCGGWWVLVGVLFVS